MKLKAITLSSILALGLASPIYGFATEKSESSCKKECPHKSQKKRLTDSQKSAIKKILMSYKDQVKPLRNNMRELRKTIANQYDSQNPSWSVIEETTKQMNDTRAKLTLIKQKIRYEIYKETGVKFKPRKMKHLR